MLFQLLFDIILSHISLDTTEIETMFAISLQICRYLFCPGNKQIKHILDRLVIILIRLL